LGHLTLALLAVVYREGISLKPANRSRAREALPADRCTFGASLRLAGFALECAEHFRAIESGSEPTPLLTDVILAPTTLI